MASFGRWERTTSSWPATETIFRATILIYPIHAELHSDKVDNCFNRFSWVYNGYILVEFNYFLKIIAWFLSKCSPLNGISLTHFYLTSIQYHFTNLKKETPAFHSFVCTIDLRDLYGCKPHYRDSFVWPTIFSSLSQVSGNQIKTDCSEKHCQKWNFQWVKHRCWDVNGSRRLISTLLRNIISCNSPVGNSQVEKSQVEKSQVEKSQVEKSLVEKSLVGKSLVGKSLVGKSLVGKSPVGKSLVGSLLEQLQPLLFSFFNKRNSGTFSMKSGYTKPFHRSNSCKFITKLNDSIKNTCNFSKRIIKIDVLNFPFLILMLHKNSTLAFILWKSLRLCFHQTFFLWLGRVGAH